MKLWEKGIETKQLVMDFTAGKDRLLDLQISSEDVIASMAHVKMLEKTGLVSLNDKNRLLQELLAVYELIQKGEFRIEDGMEDIHSQVEKLLILKLGDAGKKVHTARSRNDQVITDLKLFYRSAIILMVEEIKNLVEELLSLSEEHKNVEIPGYTHMQVAMPSSFGLWFGAWAESLTEDLQLLSGAFRYINQNPLGSAAGYGSSFPIDREYTTRLLEFEDLHINSVNAQLSRGKAEKTLMAGISGVAKSLSGMSVDMVLFMNQNFDFMGLTDEFTTGSSIMPHKKNPDILELIRAKANRIQVKEFEVFSVINNLPSGYHRDFQLLKEITFPALDDLFEIIRIMSAVLENIIIKKENTASDIYKYLGTVDAMSQKVMKGIPYRDAYREVAEEIKSGKYKATERFEHSHIGSLGNLGTERIRKKLENECAGFQLEKYKNFPQGFINAIKKECNA